MRAADLLFAIEAAAGIGLSPCGTDGTAGLSRSGGALVLANGEAAFALPVLSSDHGARSAGWLLWCGARPADRIAAEGCASKGSAGGHQLSP